MSENHQILIGDCIDMMRTLPDKSVNTCVTSPPYFGLRDYGVEGQIGLEETPAAFIARLVEVFREVRRVLRDDGTAWVNMGDSYAGSWGAHGRDDMGVGVSTISQRQVMASQRKGKATTHAEYKPKDLMGMPWRLAFALQDDGWYLRQDIIWHKPNPMPESTQDRCTKAHEYIFLLSKSRRYHCDMRAIRETAIGGQSEQASQFERAGASSLHVIPGQSAAQHRKGNRKTFRGGGVYTGNQSFDNDTQAENDSIGNQDNTGGTRNKRSVWTVATTGFKGAHFATFPLDLIRPCVLAGAPRGGIVLDPFGGAGTTSLVSMQEGRRSILCELNPEYAALARARIDSAWLDGAAQMDVFHDAAPAA
jgi:site-specific DNA-methyltransferase (adenine-specific)